MDFDCRKREGAGLVSSGACSPTRDTGIFSALVSWSFLETGVSGDVGSYSVEGLESEGLESEL